ncbi:MAG: SDR family NAD(P)-dependent oxidoreductase [Candidatus Dormibacteraeota bacterium]|nr:SDR family NAD(P)-dependent oxidoreductase [Candidatus Dormibacteraeota bacterium]
MDIDGKAALVTGGASGLGRATAEALTANGASVTIVDLATSPGQEVADALPRARFVPADVTQEAEVQHAVDQAEDLRIAVCCAGIGAAARIVGREGAHPLDLFRQVIDVNLVGTFNVLRLAAARMSRLDPVEEERGVVIQTSSIAAFEGQVGQAAYAASKAGIAGLTIAAARDLAQHLIRVCTIAPGTMDTPLLGSLNVQFRERLAAAIPHPSRLGRPAEYAQLVVAIIQNPLLNGETIRLDGALRMAPR